MFAFKETPRRWLTNACFSTDNRPLFASPPRKRRDERITADNMPEVLRQLAVCRRGIGKPTPL
jgi:hypothetical protein